MSQEVSSSSSMAGNTNPLYDAAESTAGMTVTRGLLLVLVWIILGAAIISALIVFAAARHNGVPGPMALVVPLGIIGGALLTVLIYLALAVIIRGQLLLLKHSRFLARSAQEQVQISANMERHLLHLHSAVDQIVSTASGTPLATPPASIQAASASTQPPGTDGLSASSTVSPDASGQILELLTQLRDAALLTEAQRQQWATGLLEKRKAALTAEVQAAIQSEQWNMAQDLIKKIRENLPGDPLAETLTDDLVHKQREKVQQDLRAARENLRHYMAINAWDQVQQITDALEARYPDEPGIQDLLNQIRQEYHAWHRDGLAMLLSDYKDSVDHRQWVRAGSLAQQILERYPEEKLAEKIRADLATLRQNAEIQTRHELETQYADLIKRQRHQEALAIAQRVLDVYPESATAREMQKHLPKLLEIIKQEKARKPTITRTGS